jgi:hypothetical protein
VQAQTEAQAEMASATSGLSRSASPAASSPGSSRTRTRTSSYVSLTQDMSQETIVPTKDDVSTQGRNVGFAPNGMWDSINEIDSTESNKSKQQRCSTTIKVTWPHYNIVPCNHVLSLETLISQPLFLLSPPNNDRTLYSNSQSSIVNRDTDETVDEEDRIRHAKGRHEAESAPKEGQSMQVENNLVLCFLFIPKSTPSHHIKRCTPP